MNCVIEIATKKVIDGPARSSFPRYIDDPAYAIVFAPDTMKDRKYWIANTNKDGVIERDRAVINQSTADSKIAINDIKARLRNDIANPLDRNSDVKVQDMLEVMNHLRHLNNE